MTIDEAKKFVAGLLALESKRTWLAAELDPSLLEHAQNTRRNAVLAAYALGLGDEYECADAKIQNG